MFDTNELEKAMKLAQERETIRVISEDGSEKECRAKIWTMCGLDPDSSTEITWGKMCVVGGTEEMADVVMHLAQLTCVCTDIANAIVQTIPGMTQKKLQKVLFEAVKTLKEKHKECENA
jgi:hypothetical protein